MIMVMAERPPFDPVKASFYLVAFVIGVHAFVVLIGAALCFYEVATMAKSECDAKGRLGDLLAGALAAALAFAGGFIRRPPTDPPKEPPP
jgi:hypothetical protein